MMHRNYQDTSSKVVDVLGKIDLVYGCDTNVLRCLYEFVWDFPHVHIAAGRTIDQGLNHRKFKHRRTQYTYYQQMESLNKVMQSNA